MSLILAQLKPRERWGFVIYRTSYTSSSEWAKFTTMLNNWTSWIIEDYGPIEARLLHSWQKMWWFDDRARFGGASISSLRNHFREVWHTGLTDEEKRQVYLEHYIFLVVDAEVLDSVHPHSIYICEHQGEFPFVKAADGDTENEYAEGRGGGYPAWMKVKIPSVFSLYEAALDAEVQGMRAVCPRTTEWFSRDRIWLDDDNWLEEEG